MNTEDATRSLAEAEVKLDTQKGELAQLEKAETVDKAAVKAKKAEIRATEKEIKTAQAALDKAIKASVKAEEAAGKEAAKAAKVAEREAAKAAKLAKKEENRMPEQNGIRRPKPESKCGAVWTKADELSKKNGSPVAIKELLESCAGMNEGNVKAEYARWRKFYGISGRIAAQAE